MDIPQELPIELNANPVQEVPAPQDVTPIQEIPMQPEIVTNKNSPFKNKKVIFFVLISLVLVTVIVGIIIFVLNKSSSTPKVAVSPTQETIAAPKVDTDTSTFGKLVSDESKNEISDDADLNTACNNYPCLISAVSQCSPISAVISYSDMPNPLFTGIVTSGKTKYEIKKSTKGDDCTIIFSSPLTIFTFTEEGRKDAIKEGMTEDQIESQLQAMNDSMKLPEVTKLETTCSGSTSIISEYLADTEKGKVDVSVQGSLDSTSTTYTTSSGKTLNCTSGTAE